MNEMNKIITSEGNVQFQTPDGKIINVHPFHIYTVFNEDTVSFLLIAMPKSSGLAIFTSKAEDLEVDGTVYTIDELPNALSEAFAKAGAVARYEIVDELPTSGQSNTIYLVPKSEGIGYDEYIYVNGEWELIGDTDIELDRYVDKETFSGYTADTLVLINTVSGNVITESERAISAETALQTAIDNEVSARTDADEALEDYIDAVSGAVDNVQDEVDILSAALEDEVSARTDADSALQALIDTVSGDVETEVSRATSAEASLSSAIDTEIAAREAADSVISGAVDTLSTDIQNEVQRAISAETALDSKIDAVASDLDDEISARTEADTALSGAVDSVISDLASEVSRAEGAEDALDDKIDAEISNREAADSVISGVVDTLSTDIQNEAQRAISAETELSDKVDAVSGDVEDIKSEIETISDDAIVDAEYVSSSTTIDFYNASGDVVASIDASDFIVDGMVDDVRIENGYLVIDFNTASGKQDISIPLSDIFDPSNYYDKTAIDGIVSGINESIDTVSGDVITEASARTDADTALGNKIDGKVVELTQQQYDQLQDKDPLVLYVITDAVEVNMNDYYKKTETSGATEIQTALDAKLNTNDFNTYSANTQTAINGKANSADVYTKNEVYTKAEVDEAIAEIDLSEIEDRIAEDEEVTAKALNELNDKIDAIDLSEIENRLSEDEEVTAAGLNAVNDKFDGLQLKKLSQAEYDALSPNYDSNTLYIITD